MSERVRQRLSSWAFWMVLAYIGLVGVVVWSLTISRNQARDEAIHSSEVAANAAGQYAACLKSRPELAKINRFVHGVQKLHRIQKENALAQLRATPRSSLLYRVRLKSYSRFKEAADDVRGVSFHVPTNADCRQLRNELLNKH